MAREKARLQSVLDEKDARISSQRSELDRLNLLITGDQKKQRESSAKVEPAAKAAAAAQGHQHRQPKAASGHTPHRTTGSATAAAAAPTGRVPGSSFRHVARLGSEIKMILKGFYSEKIIQFGCFKTLIL